MWIQEKAGENTVKKRSLVEIARERDEELEQSESKRSHKRLYCEKKREN